VMKRQTSSGGSVRRGVMLGWLVFLSAMTGDVALAAGEATLASPSMPADPAPGLQPLRERIRGGGILRARFESRYTDGFTSESSSRSGRLWLADGAYRIETDDQVLVVKDRVSTVLDRTENRFLISDYDPEEDDFAPSRFLDASETMTETQSRSGRRTVVTLSSEDPFALWLEIRIVLDARGLPVTISGRDQGDNLIDTELSDVEWLADVVNGGGAVPPGSGAGEPATRSAHASLFTLTPPEGMEIIDLRASTSSNASGRTPS
jgi:outer membrane lipoprotein-sorting protein